MHVLAHYKLKVWSLFDFLVFYRFHQYNLQHSDIDKNNLEKLNANMKFEGTCLALRPQDIDPNPIKRQVYKGMMNSIIGKCAQKSNFPQTKYVSQAEQIEDILGAGDEIVDFQTLSQDICELEIGRTTESNNKHRKSNPIITAFVTSLSRIDMHKNILLLDKNHCSPYYTDTDSLIFSVPKTTTLPFELNGGLGYFKPEYREPITGFCCIGRKSYVVCTKAEETEMKICGLSFQSHVTQSAVSFRDFERLVREKVPLKKVPQSRTYKRRTTLGVYKTIKNVQIPSGLNFNRSIKSANNQIFTVPYGYTILPEANKTK